MGALDKRLYTSHHAPTDSVSRLEPDCVKLACPGCWWPSAARLSLLRYCTHTPHPCTVLTTAHNIHTRPPDAPARLSYQRTLMNPYCMFDLADLARETALGALSQSHAARTASTSLVSDAETCLTRKTLRPIQQPVVAPALAGALVAMTTVDVLGIAAILFHLTILAGLAALSRGTKISLVTSSASFCFLAYNSGGCSRVEHLAVLSHSGGGRY